MADCCCFCMYKKNRLAPTESQADKKNVEASTSNEASNISDDFTEVEIDDKEDHEPDGTWTVTGIFKSIFHASPDNKLAVKLYGNKNMVKKDQEIQEKGCSKWMIHPYSHFR